LLCSILNEWPIKIITIECDENEWLGLSDMLKEFKEKLLFIWFIEHFEEAIDGVLRLWAVFEVLDVISNDLSICNQETFAINDV
jgi:hypothetical protein